MWTFVNMLCVIMGFNSLTVVQHSHYDVAICYNMFVFGIVLLHYK